MCCETIGLALAGQKDAAQLASFAATTQKPINIGVCVAKKKEMHSQTRRETYLQDTNPINIDLDVVS